MSEGFNNIKRVRGTFEISEVNKALKAGWKLIGVAPGQDETKFPITKYTLGHHLSEEEAEAVKARKK
ncbi:hypothetical protein ACLE23_004725 [Pseudomonas aeruginosa]|nr:hypothetical protein [Pseudomonas aeruginosa]